MSAGGPWYRAVCVCVLLCCVCPRAHVYVSHRMWPVFTCACRPTHPAGLVLDKSHSNKDWRQRPLPQEMIDYAITDTEHLHVLRQ